MQKQYIYHISTSDSWTNLLSSCCSKCWWLGKVVQIDPVHFSLWSTGGRFALKYMTTFTFMQTESVEHILKPLRTFLPTSHMLFQIVFCLLPLEMAQHTVLVYIFSSLDDKNSPECWMRIWRMWLINNSLLPWSVVSSVHCITQSCRVKIVTMNHRFFFLYRWL